MRIAFVTKEPQPTIVDDFSNRGLNGGDAVWLKAKGLAERGHEVWVLSPESSTQGAGRFKGVMHIRTSQALMSGHEGTPSMPKPWSAVAADELLRLHHDHAIDIIDIPLDFIGICRYFSMPSGKDRMPAIVQIGEAPQGETQRCEAQLQLYRFDGEISFTPSNPIESHIAILRLENFFHGVLNRHFATHLPAA